MRKICILLACLGLVSVSYSQGFLKADGQRIVNAKGENILLRGMGLGGWMLQEGYMLGINKNGQQYLIKQRIDSLIGSEKTEEFYNAWLKNHTSKHDIDSLKAWGFNSVRLPMHYNLYTLPVEEEKVAGTQTWINKGFEMTDSLIEWCRANNLYLILDLHAAPGGQGNDNNISDRNPAKLSLWESEANRRKTIELWKKLAERYRNNTTVAGYDLINEPNWGFEDANDKNGLKEPKNEPLEKLMRDITSAIRQIDTNHLIIIEGNGWGNNYSGMLDDGLWDKNMALSFHKYWNYNDQQSIANILQLRKKYNVPVWLGETGENSNTWFTQAIELLESNNIGWAWWPLKKLGHNNPLQVKRNDDYNSIADYWNGKTSVLPKIDFFKTFMSFAENTHISRNIYHPDVVDAMIRQPFTNDTRPFKNHLIHQSASIKAVDYDLGKNGFAYYDLDTANYRVSGKPGIGNKGNTYRNDGVDIFRDETTEDPYVGSFEAGEWLKFTVYAELAGNYLPQLLVSANEKAVVELTINADRGKTISVTVSNDKDKWNLVSLNEVSLEKGLNTIRLKLGEGKMNLKEIVLTRK